MPGEPHERDELFACGCFLTYTEEFGLVVRTLSPCHVNCPNFAVFQEWRLQTGEPVRIISGEP
jgi:hypothetical protein